MIGQSLHLFKFGPCCHEWIKTTKFPKDFETFRQTRNWKLKQRCWKTSFKKFFEKFDSFWSVTNKGFQVMYRVRHMFWPTFIVLKTWKEGQNICHTLYYNCNHYLLRHIGTHTSHLNKSRTNAIDTYSRLPKFLCSSLSKT